MKIINLQGMTTGERLAYLEELCQDIYNHLYDDYIWTFDGAYVSNDSSYTATRLSGYQDNLDLKTGQIVYFAGSGVVALIDKINDVANTFTVKDNYIIKGDKGEQGIQGIQGIQGETGKTGLEALQTNIVLAVDEKPSTNDVFGFNTQNFNRTPVVGDKFVSPIYVRNPVDYILASFEVTSVNDLNTSVKYTGGYNFSDILPNSAKKQLYLHIFDVQLFINSNTSFYFTFNVITTNYSIKSSTNATLTDLHNILKSFLSGGVNEILVSGIDWTDYESSSIGTDNFLVMSLRYTGSDMYLRESKINSNKLRVAYLIQNNEEKITAYTLTLFDTMYSIGNDGNTLVLYADENGVLLDNDRLSEQFNKMVKAGSDKSKILESINKVRSMNL